MPRYGGVEGGQEIKFIGEGFSTTTTDYTIELDDVACEVTAATSTEVTCTTGPRIGAWEKDPKLKFTIANIGKIAE